MNRKHCVNCREGQIIVFFVASLVVICGMVVLAIDVGHLAESSSSLQNAADAGTLAGMNKHYEARSNGASESSARDDGGREADSIANANHSGVGYKATWGRWEDKKFVEYDSNVPANAVKLRVYRDAGAPKGAVSTFFGGFFGWDSVAQEAEAVARFENPDLVPFAVYEEDIAAVGEKMTFYNDEELAPGVFGMLNFDGGDQSASDLKEWTADGWDGELEIDPDAGSVKVNGIAGLKSSISKPAGDHIKEGNVVVGCIYDDVEGKASDADFNVTGFISLVITDQKLVDEEYEYIEGRVEGVYYGDTGKSAGSMRNTVRLHLAQ